jgi:hypothetical protein
MLGFLRKVDSKSPSPMTSPNKNKEYLNLPPDVQIFKVYFTNIYQILYLESKLIAIFE